MISNPINFPKTLYLKHKDAAAHEGGEDGTAADTANGASSMDGGASGEAPGDTKADDEPCRITFGSFDGQDGTTPATASTNGGASGEASGDTKADDEPCRIMLGWYNGQDGTIPAAVSTKGGASGEASGDTKAEEGKLGEAVGDGGDDPLPPLAPWTVVYLAKRGTMPKATVMIQHSFRWCWYSFSSVFFSRCSRR